MLIPSFLISAVTFPGVILRPAAQKSFCALVGAKVEEVCYFRLSSPTSYVRFEPPASVWRYMVIGIGPMVMQSLIAFSIGFTVLAAEGRATIPVLLRLLLLWLGLSLAMHSFPTTEDTQGMWKSLQEGNASAWAKVIGLPLVALAFVGAYGSIVWIDLIYGLGVAVALPLWISFQ